MLNKVILNGRLTSAPSVAASGKSAVLTLAVQRDFKNKDGNYDTDFIPVFVNGEKAVAAWCAYFTKGDGVLIEGQIRMAKNKDDDGTHMIITCGFPEFGTVGKKAKASTAVPAQTSTTPDEFEDLDDGDEDLPF